MPFGLCNAPATFQRCVTAIFSDFCEKIVDVFIDDFSVYGTSFDDCLSNLDRVFQRCEQTNLILNWEKCHFMVNESIVLGHKISERGIEVDKEEYPSRKQKWTHIFRKSIPHKVLQSGFNWPTLFKDAHKFVPSCDECQRIGNIGKRQEMPMNYSLAVEPFVVWGFD